MTAIPDPSRGDQVLARATEALRRHTPTGWRVVRAHLLELVRRTHRPSVPVRGRHGRGEFVVSGGVLTTRVRQAVERTPAAEVTAVRCVTGADDHLALVTVETGVHHGAHIPTTAAAVRVAVTAAVRDVVGEDRGVRVHVHVVDVIDGAGGAVGAVGAGGVDGPQPPR
ncbi:hypothetical protein AB2L27_08675 [Kineococcus sp. LSe6-4]|uniref:Asp23/Gls24 family envelope stress response protein n=1 Tax=Kineococcus halophytocola TaxID=3234027 RepID=A0ABV4H2D8_9ACTN